MKSGRMGFRTIVVLGGAILMFVPALSAGWLYSGALQQDAERMVAQRLQSRGELAAGLLARRLYATWRAVSEYATRESANVQEEARRDFTLIETLDERIAWIGMADLQGKVTAASRDMLQGVDVSQRPWFRRGLAGPFAGDVHEALLLAKLLAKNDEPLRFVDFAAPIQSGGQEVRGVIGAHIRWEWLRDQLAGMSTKDTDLFLVSREGRVLYGPADLEGKMLGSGIGIVAGQARTVVRAQTWPDGREYITAIIPAVNYRDLPSFGWSVVVRENLEVALDPIRRLTRTFWSILGSAGLISLAFLSIGAGWLAKPLRRQGAFASALAVGHLAEPPFEETRYREAAELSAALVRLQSRLASSQSPPGEQVESSGRRPA